MNSVTRLWIVLALNLALVGGLVAVGLAAHSLAVLAEGADYLADGAAVGGSLLALWLAGRPPTAARPLGYSRAPAVAALVNSGWILVLSLLVAAGSLDRLVRGARPVHGLPVLVASGVGALVMVGAALVLRGDLDDDADAGAKNREHVELNMRAVLLDTVADAAAAGAVAVTGAVMLAAGGLYWLDPAVALVVAAVVAYHAVALLGRVRRALHSPP